MHRFLRAYLSHQLSKSNQHVRESDQIQFVLCQPCFIYVSFYVDLFNSFNYLVGWLTVEWDTGLRNAYRYGTTHFEEEKYDVQVCNEPRILKNQRISAGCQAKRGL